MITPENMRIQVGESLKQYLVRLWSNKDEYEIDKYTIANLMNEEAGTEYDESKWRKDYASYLNWKPHFIEENLDDEIQRKYELLRIENEKERYRKSDQKREYRKFIKNQSRFEKLQSDIIYAVHELNKSKPLPSHSNVIDKGIENKHGLALFSDWHFGMEVDNSVNKFNKEIFNLRVAELVEKVIAHGKKNNISTLHVANLGDMISGSIHISTRVQANEDLIEQITYVSEVLADVINKLSNEFSNIVYYNVIGNHGRAGRKDEVGLKENYEYLIPWFLEARLKDLNNVEITTDKDGYIESKIFNEEIVYVHGNFDRADQAVNKLPQLLGYVPSYIIGGHVHHHYEREYGKTTTITNSALIGLDDHATSGRYGGKPAQKFLVFDEQDGLECEYIIKFKN